MNLSSYARHEIPTSPELTAGEPDGDKFQVRLSTEAYLYATPDELRDLGATFLLLAMEAEHRLHIARELA